MFNLNTFERQMCSGSQPPAWFSSCLMFRFVFSLYSTSRGPTIHLDYDLLECDAVQVHRYRRFGRTCFFFSKQQVPTKHCCLWNRVHGVTQDENYPDLPENSKLTIQLYIYISIRSSSLLVGDSSTNSSVSTFIDPVRQITNVSVGYTHQYIYLSSYRIIF
jgi:hypothetical protein